MSRIIRLILTINYESVNPEMVGNLAWVVFGLVGFVVFGVLLVRAMRKKP